VADGPSEVAEAVFKGRSYSSDMLLIKEIMSMIVAGILVIRLVP